MKKILLSILMLCCMTAAWAQGDGFVTVASSAQMRGAIQANNSAKVRLTADIYLSDLGEEMGTLCSTFSGILDGDGHTVYGDHYGDNSTKRRDRNYLFTYSDGATFKNLTFKHIRKNSEDHSNQAIITSQAKNHCVFDNITFDNVGTWSAYDNAGSAAGWAENCTFTNITVKNSDFTVDHNQSGCVVGHAIGCTFSNIKVENCESTSAAKTSAYEYGKSGGVVGRSDNCTFNNVEIRGSFIKSVDEYVGGVAGYSTNSKYTNCTTDDQSCIAADNVTAYFGGDAPYLSYVGGIVGSSDNDEIYNCINSALITGQGHYAGGIVGGADNDKVIIDGCLNTGLVIAKDIDDVKGEDGFYIKYKNKTGMTCVTKTYQGKEYVIRKYDGDDGCLEDQFGGIAGYLKKGTVSKCANFGTVIGQGAVIHGGNSGGIVGDLTNGTISDCLSDFSGYKDNKGICGKIGTSTIKNCLNMTSFIDYVVYSTTTTTISGENNYSLTTAEEAVKLKNITKTTTAEINSGKIGYLLGANWEQNLGTDACPTLGNKGVYHSRSVSNEYGTVCLPFPVQSDDNIRYYTFSEAYNDNGDVLLGFDYAEDKIPAGTPLLFRVRNLGENCFNNAGFDSNESWADSPQPENKNVTWDFRGTFYKYVFGGTATRVYYLSDGVIKNAEHTTVPPYRAFFWGPYILDLTNNSGSKANIRFVVEDEDGTTSIITPSEWSSLPSREGWGGSSYSVMGTEVGDNYRGIVIKNGKKYIRK